MNIQNWAGNHTFHPARYYRPKTRVTLQEIVARARKVRALGSRHSFNEIADTPSDLISLEHFDQVVALDRERSTVTVEAGIRYGALGEYLQREGYALHNMASLPHISVAGACATATHGSGDGNGNLATAVVGIEMVTAYGEIVTLSRDSELFPGAVVSLGGLGIVTKHTLNVEPTYPVRQDVYEDLPFSQLITHFEEITSHAYSVSLFTDWSNADRVNQVWLKHRVLPEDDGPANPTWLGATLATRAMHPIATMSAENCTTQGGIPGPWQERLPHFRYAFTPSSGDELQSEYLVPRSQAIAAIQALHGMREQITPLLQISEIRTIAADDLWISPCYQTPCVGLHFTWVKDWPAVRNLLPRIEEKLAPFQARPHWGKLFTMSPETIQSLYPKLADFRQLLRQYDPQGKFSNPFLDTYIGA